MKENENKYVDKLAEDVMKLSVLDSPSNDFTSNVMQQISANSKSVVTVYKPLISKMGWIAMLLSVLALIFIMVVSGDSQNSEWFNTIDFSVLTNLFSGIKLSNTTLYAFIFFGAMVCVQIPLLKNYFDNRLNM